MMQHAIRRAAAAKNTQVVGAIVRRAMSSEAPSSAMTLNFNLPHETIYDGASVAQVIVPGVEGEYGVTAGHVPIVTQLKAGVLQILHEDSTAEPEKYFVAGGFSITHPNSVTDISCPEAVKLDDLDPAALTANFEAAKSAYSSAEAGSIPQAEAQVEMEVNRSMGEAIGVTLG